MRETLLSFLDDCIALGEETAVVHWRGLRLSRWSYARIAATAFQFARELESRGIGAGDRVLFWSENSPEWIAAFYGCLLRGAVGIHLVEIAHGFLPDGSSRMVERFCNVFERGARKCERA